MQENEETSLRKQVDEKLDRLENAESYREKKKSTSTPVCLKSNRKLNEFVESTIQKVQEFLDSSESEMDIEPCNSFYRKALHDHIPLKFGDKVFLEYKNSKGRRHMVVYRGSESDIIKAKKEVTKRKTEEAFNEAVGFSKIIRLITKTEKLMVGHNMLYDLMYAVRQYVCDLPDNLLDFKALCRCAFPSIADTKLMAGMIPFKDMIESTALGDLYSKLKKSPFKQVKLEAPVEYLGNDQDLAKNLHEAAYDAYITGYSFLLMHKHLNSFHDPSMRTNVINKDSCVVQPYLNKINITHLYEIPFLDMVNDEMLPSYDDVFHLSFPAEWKLQEVRDRFAPYNVNVSWINLTSCYVRVIEKCQVKAVRKMVLKSNCQKSRVQTFVNFHKEKAEKEQLERKEREEKNTAPPTSQEEEKGGKKREAAAEQSADDQPEAKRVKKFETAEVVTTKSSDDAPVFEVPSF